MKFKRCILFVLLMVLSVALFSCDDTPDNPVTEPCIHQWSEWNTKEEATCTKEGLRERICNICSEKENEKTPKLEHKYVPATCETPKKCSVCNKEEGEALGHNYKYEYLDETTHKYGCSRCDAGESVQNHTGGTATCQAKKYA